MNIDNLVSYYQTFESDIEKLSRYIEICDDNFEVYSVELTRLYLAICSEVDVSLKVLCDIVSDKNTQNMKEYVKVIRENCPSLTEYSVDFVGHNVNCSPWAGLENSDSLIWWTDHNKVKHNRMEHYKKANLGNVLMSFTALYTINLYILFETKCRISKVFRSDFPRFLSETSQFFKKLRLRGVPFGYIHTE